MDVQAVEAAQAVIPTPPMATPPQPGTAVKEAPRSIVLRMNFRSSAARPPREMGSDPRWFACREAEGEGGGVEVTMKGRISGNQGNLKYFALQI